MANTPNGILNHHPIRTGPGADEAGVELSQKLNEWLEHSGPSSLFRTCQSCKQMKRGGAPAFCDRFQSTPPVDIIMRGCDFHEDEAIAPF